MRSPTRVLNAGGPRRVAIYCRLALPRRFHGECSERANEVPEKSWNNVGLLNENVVVGGVARGSMDAVRAFVAQCVQRANEHIATDRAERLHALHNLEQLRAQDEEARKLTKELREQSN